jgi:glycosidase
MTPYIGSHDTPRFVSLADYRGQDAATTRASRATSGTTPRWPRRTASRSCACGSAMAWLLGLPGAPLLYYGDEYGQWGGADPNNRR